MSASRLSFLFMHFLIALGCLGRGVIFEALLLFLGPLITLTLPPFGSFVAPGTLGTLVALVCLGRGVIFGALLLFLGPLITLISYHSVFIIIG